MADDDTGRAQPGLKQDLPQLNLPDVYVGKPSPDYAADIPSALRSAYKAMVDNGVTPWNAREALLPPADEVLRAPLTFGEGEDLAIYGQGGRPQTGDPVIGGGPAQLGLEGLRGYTPGDYYKRTYDYVGMKNAADTQPELEDQRWWGANLQRNRAFLNPGATAPYNTQLPPQQEAQFRAWLTDNKIPFNPDLPVSDYDMRGYWAALQAGDPHAKQEVDPNDNRPHFPDYWKTPLSPTFSSDSQWANPEVAPRWDGDNYRLPNGQILWDDKAQKWIGPNPPWGPQSQAPQPALPRMGGVPTANSLLQQIMAVPPHAPQGQEDPSIVGLAPRERDYPKDDEYGHIPQQGPALTPLSPRSLLQQIGTLHGFGDMDEQEKAGNLVPSLVPYLFAPGNTVRPGDITNPPYYRPGMYGPPANEAALQQAPLLQQAALLRMLLPGGLVGPGGYKPMPGTQDNPLLQPGEEGAVVGSRPVPGSRDRNRFFNPNGLAPYNPPGVPDDRSQET
jgi:hypothetical protein